MSAMVVRIGGEPGIHSCSYPLLRVCVTAHAAAVCLRTGWETGSQKALACPYRIVGSFCGVGAQPYSYGVFCHSLMSFALPSVGSPSPEAKSTSSTLTTAPTMRQVKLPKLPTGF